MEIAQRLNRHFGQRSYDKGLQLYVFGHCLVGTLAAYYIPYVANSIRGAVVAPTFRESNIAQTGTSMSYGTRKISKSGRNAKVSRRYYRFYKKRSRPRRRRRRRRRRY